MAEYMKEFGVETPFRAVRTSAPQSYNPQKLRGKHYAILRLHCLGFKNTEIAEALGVTLPMVSYTINSDLGQQRIAYMQGQLDAESVDIQRELKTIAPEAIETLVELMHSETEKGNVRSNIAFGLLDRAGHSPVKRLDVTHSDKITDEEIEAIKKDAYRNGRLSGVVVEDADFEDVSEDSLKFNESSDDG